MQSVAGQVTSAASATHGIHPGKEGHVQHFAQERTLETNYLRSCFHLREMG